MHRITRTAAVALLMAAPTATAVPPANAAPAKHMSAQGGVFHRQTWMTKANKGVRGTIEGQRKGRSVRRFVLKSSLHEKAKTRLSINCYTARGGQHRALDYRMRQGSQVFQIPQKFKEMDCFATGVVYRPVKHRDPKRPIYVETVVVTAGLPS